MTFRIVWTTPSGRFGSVTISECVNMDEAITHWDTEVRGVNTPWDAVIDAIRPL